VGQVFNVYCDESCHLESDHQNVMVLGAIWCPLEKVREIALRIKKVKIRHNLSPYLEVKWTKVSPAKVEFYLDLVDLFFDSDDLHFRALIVPDKSRLNHTAYQQTHDEWYYKMYFDMLKVIFDPESRYRIYLDIKDTHGATKIIKLHDVLCNNLYDFSREIIERVQIVRSHEVQIMQLADLLIGAISYANRDLLTNAGKLALVDRMRTRSRYSLTRTTLLRETKVNIFRWHASEVQG